ncbi:hypothetical protein ANRL1_04744 [Anaerolineae bacterium]|nr:hypothetical protein ANRL1_04744 [Anaerolineae bacterium]
MQTPEERLQFVTSDQEIEKKQYEKPEILYQAPLEAMASDCNTGGKAPAGCTPSFS